MQKQYDPSWPFPQYDEEGKQLLPENFGKKQPINHYPDDLEESLL